MTAIMTGAQDENRTENDDSNAVLLSTPDRAAGGQEGSSGSKNENDAGGSGDGRNGVGGGADDDCTSVQVAVRVRPLLAMEADTDVCIRVTDDSSTALQIGGSSGPRFTFDHVFDRTSTQTDVYTTKVSELVDSCLEGYNATILAYGQTGSGKVSVTISN